MLGKASTVLVPALVAVVSYTLKLFVRSEFNSSLLKADTRTDKHDTLGLALLQHQNIGILPSALREGTEEEDNYNQGPRLLQPPMSTSMPPTWVRGAILVRANSLIRGHSAIRWDLIVSMASLLNKNITPVGAIDLDKCVDNPFLTRLSLFGQASVLREVKLL